MYPFWDLIISPVLTASRARRVVEIGALRGETTARMIEALGDDTEVHVIDPLPQFDPEVHEAEFPGQYYFHRALSLDVLDELPPFDAALVDGDHNWYTVYNELHALARVCERAEQPLPVLFLHDVGWPYGRRDLYYDPDTIPADSRQPYAVRGIRRERSQTVERGGFNLTLANADEEGGLRNGVMTGLEDFLAEFPRPVRLFTTPVYFGLAVVVEEATLDANPEVTAILDHLESIEGQRELLDLGEEIRTEAARWEQLVFAHRERQVARGVERYLRVLRGALLHEHAAEHDLRIDHLLDVVARGVDPDPEILADPIARLRDGAKRLDAAQRHGRQAEPSRAPIYFAPTDMGQVRLEALEAELDSLRSTSVAGDLVECGTGRGGGAIFMQGYLEAHEIDDRTVWVVDEFRSPASESPAAGRGFVPASASLAVVREGFEVFHLLDERVRFLSGRPADSLADAAIERVALLRLGSSLDPAHAPAVLDHLLPQMEPGGAVIVDGVVELAGVVAPLLEAAGCMRERIDDHASRWRVPHRIERAGAVDASSGQRVPLADGTATDSVDLSVVVVFYDMQREALRTLHSLSRAYQRDLDGVAYEVIVVENGSPAGRALDATDVEAYGPEFRLLALTDEASSSPTTALNRGLEEARGDVVAFMIDGAHVLTPRVLHHGMVGMQSYAPAVVATQQWYVGPGQQPELMGSGYDQSAEDHLFEAIEWPVDGYRLFDIGHFIGDRDWFDGMWESNCIFVSRSLLAQVGGFDDSFDTPGGGYANLEFFERMASSPGTNLVTMIGEGSFHQVHGGTTTNVDTAEERQDRIASYAARYAELRGRPFQSPHKPVHVVGQVIPSARRTKARRRLGSHFFAARAVDGPDGRPSIPQPVPEDLVVDFIDAYWRAGAAEMSEWLGRPTGTPPTDLFAYQRIIAATRPDWVVVTGADPGGRARFLADVCDAAGHGRVLVVVPPSQAMEVFDHDRITVVSGRLTHDESLMDQIRELVGPDPTAMVILAGQLGMRPTMREFDLLSPLVPIDGYIVVEYTIVNGRPVWAGFGPGPGDAVDKIVARRGAFIADPVLESQLVTFNRGGFLKHVLRE